MALVPRPPVTEMALVPRQENRGQSQMDLLAAVSVKYPCQHQGCIKWALLSTNGERKYCITHMKEYGLSPWRKGCQHPECTKRAQTAITGEVLFCKVHMRLYGLLPKQKMCAHGGCSRVASASQDGKYLYCKTHMKEYGMMPKKDKKVCAHEGCTKIAAATVDGEYKYCKSHMKEYGLQKRKYVKYCRHPECTKRAKRSTCGQWIYCRGHMRLYGMIPEGCKNNPSLLTGPQVVQVLEGPAPTLALPAPGHEHADYTTDGGMQHKDDEHLLYQPGSHTAILMGDDPNAMQRLALQSIPRGQLPASQAAQLAQALQLPLPPLRVEHPAASSGIALPLQIHQYMPGLTSDVSNGDLSAQLQELHAAANAAVGVPHPHLHDSNAMLGMVPNHHHMHIKQDGGAPMPGIPMTEEEAMAQAMQAVQVMHASLPNGLDPSAGVAISMPMASMPGLHITAEMQLAAAMEAALAQQHHHHHHHHQQHHQQAHAQAQAQHEAEQQAQHDALVQSMVEDPEVAAAAAAAAAAAGGELGVGKAEGLGLPEHMLAEQQRLVEAGPSGHGVNGGDATLLSAESMSQGGADVAHVGMVGPSGAGQVHELGGGDIGIHKRKRPGEVGVGGMGEGEGVAGGVEEGVHVSEEGDHGASSTDMNQPLKKRRSMYAAAPAATGGFPAQEFQPGIYVPEGTDMAAVMQAAQAAYTQPGGEADDWLQQAAAAMAAAAYGWTPHVDENGNAVLQDPGMLDPGVQQQLQQLQAVVASLQGRPLGEGEKLPDGTDPSAGVVGVEVGGDVDTVGASAHPAEAPAGTDAGQDFASVAGGSQGQGGQVGREGQVDGDQNTNWAGIMLNWMNDYGRNVQAE